MIPIVEVAEVVSSAGPCTLKPLKDFQFMKPSELMQIGFVFGLCNLLIFLLIL